MPEALRVIVACERSGIVREAFRRLGHHAWSNDLVPADDGSEYHLIGNCLDVIAAETWDLVIAHPPCTHLCVSGNRWYAGSPERELALLFIRKLLDVDVPMLALENPIGVISSQVRKPDQIINPWQFAQSFHKPTCLWLKSLPPLTPTNIVSKGKFDVLANGKRLPAWYNMPPGPERSRIRSLTFTGIADAMADQWGGHVAR